jgi:hypothetical protein
MNSQKRKVSDSAWLGLVIFACISGFGIGSISVFLYQKSIESPVQNSSNPVPSQSEGSLPVLENNQVPTEDGLFVYSGGQFTKLPETLDDNQIDFGNLPAVETRPTFAMRGNYPLGSLLLKPYIAGIGVNVEFEQNGATIKSVFPNSPAQLAGLQTGEIIITVDGQVPQTPMVYKPDSNDLFDIMKEKITLQVLSGTSTRNVELARSFRQTLPSKNEGFGYIYNRIVKYAIESKEGYIIIRLDTELESGVYRFEFSENSGISSNPAPQNNLPPQKWIFVVR